MSKITLRPTQKQYEAWEALKTKDVVYFGGGAGSGKSWWLCETRLVNCYLFPGYRSFIGREELKRLMQSTFVTWNKVCQHHKIPKEDWKLNGQYNYIEFKNGSRVDLLDLKFLPSDPLYERFGSLEYSDGAIEEAGEVHYLAYDVLKSRIGRHMSSEVRPTLALTGNPKKNWTYSTFYKPYKEKTLAGNIEFIQALYKDNEYTSKEYGRQLAQITDKSMKERLMFGNWEYDDDPNAMIPYDAIIDLFSNEIEKDKEWYVVADIARYGHDKTVVGVWKGLDLQEVYIWEKQDLQTTKSKIDEIARDRSIPRSHIAIDEDGVGGGVVDMLPGCKGFVNNSSPTDDGYQNLKTQCYYLLAEKINKREMRISADLGETEKALLIEELEQVKRRDADKENKLKIISKEDIKEILGRSPDIADMLMMRMLFELKQMAGGHKVIQRQQIHY